MTTNLPAGIEASLREAGFSGTEMIVLKKLVEEDCLTLRELASKTGKSTGVLDIAMKKLLSKKIARKENINDQPKYCIHSLEAIVQWVKQDMKDRKETLDRKHQNFETFIASLKVDKVRPDMEYFQGKEGILKAYDKLLEAGNELLTIAPIVSTIEDDPLRAFRVDYFRRRQVRKIFQRIIAPDTVLARRFQSRDPFEYRKTILVPEQELALSFEKTIVGSTVACIDLINETACFIRYPKLADAEKAQFEGMWLRGLTEENQQAPQMKTAIPFKTRFLSYVRQFVLSPRGIFTALFIGCISAALTIGMYQNTRALNLERMKDKVLSIALTGAMQIDLHDLEVLKVQADWRRPEWSKVVNIIKNMRLGNRDITYVYIFRKSMTGSGLEFIADSHSINPFANTDTDFVTDHRQGRRIDDRRALAETARREARGGSQPGIDSFEGELAVTAAHQQGGHAASLRNQQCDDLRLHVHPYRRA